MATQTDPELHEQHSVIKSLPLVKLMREGSEYPAGYAFVRYRPEFLGTEVALLPFNYVLKLYHWLRRSAYREWTEEEIQHVKLTLQVMNERGDRRYQEGYQKGRTDGENQAARFWVLLTQQATNMKRQIFKADLKQAKKEITDTFQEYLQADIPDWDSEYGMCNTCDFQPTDDTKDCLCVYRNRLRDEVKARISKL